MPPTQVDPGVPPRLADPPSTHECSLPGTRAACGGSAHLLPENGSVAAGAGSGSGQLAPDGRPAVASTAVLGKRAAGSRQQEEEAQASTPLAKRASLDAPAAEESSDGLLQDGKHSDAANVEASAAAAACEGAEPAMEAAASSGAPSSKAYTDLPAAAAAVVATEPAAAAAAAAAAPEQLPRPLRPQQQRRSGAAAAAAGGGGRCCSHCAAACLCCQPE
jgi:hypothetical protein